MKTITAINKIKKLIENDPQSEAYLKIGSALEDVAFNCVGGYVEGFEDFKLQRKTQHPLSNYASYKYFKKH